MPLHPDHLFGTSVQFSVITVRNIVITPINARLKSVNTVRPLVTLLKNVGRRLAILLPATMRHQHLALTIYSQL